MTFGKEGHRLGKAGQYLSSAVADPAEVRARVRAEFVDRELPWIVDEVLASDEIATGIAQAGMDSAALRRQVFDARQEILAPADSRLERAFDAAMTAPSRGSTVTSEGTPGRVGGIVGMLVSGVFIFGPATAIVVWREDLAWWIVAPGLVLAFVLAVLGIIVYFQAVEELRSARPDHPPQEPLELWRQACRDEGVLPFVRRLVDEHLAPIARTLLNVTIADAPGLRGTSDSSYMVRTGSVRNFQKVAEQLPTGAIGIAGPRGVGKTSLIEHFAGHADSTYRPLKVLVPAPVQYESMDFVLHLFASVCQSVLRERRHFLPIWPAVLLRFFWPVILLGGAVWTAMLVVGADVLAEPKQVLDEVRAFNPWLIPVVLLTLGGVGALPVAVRNAVRTVRQRRETDILRLARRHLETIHYLRVHTSGWSGKVPLPLRTEAGWSRQTQRERRAQTYPELVDALRGFLAAFGRTESHTPAVIVAIDELDKIESADDAQKFVNEIKGIFGAPDTQFLVAVSEDALASFERRGLPVRDAFDSAFHEIVRIDYLTLADTAELLSSRVLRLPEPFKWLVHCMSGGLPRDVVRTARAMVALGDTPAPSLDDVCAALVADDLSRKSHAFQLACRDIGDSPEVTGFIRSLRRLPGNADTLLGLVPVLRQDGDLATLSRQAAAYVYYSATLLQVFTRERVDSHGSGTFNLLARARQSLAVHPRLAWLQIDEFREAWKLDIVPVD